jgi:hypothetical protein
MGPSSLAFPSTASCPNKRRLVFGAIMSAARGFSFDSDKIGALRLEAVYPIVWLDGLVGKVRHNKQVVNKSAHVVLGVNLQGEKEVLGLWLAEAEGAKFWLSVLTELRHRGVPDIYIACMDGLDGLPEAVNAVFPRTPTQLCVYASCIWCARACAMSRRPTPRASSPR